MRRPERLRSVLARPNFELIMTDLKPLTGIVVHHRRFPKVLGTVTALIQDGLPPDCLVVVDNSEENKTEADLRAALPAGVRLVCMPNRGFGAAVNAGLAELQPSDRILVASHEALVHSGAIASLDAALSTDDRIVAAGPTLVMRRSGGLIIWSEGGLLTARLRLPRHVGHLTPYPPPHAPQIAAEDRAWLDGACVLYRGPALRDYRLREDFFLYFEEAELHRRFAAAGWRLAWVPAAIVEQSSDGVPPYYLARNLQLFQHAHGTPVSRMLAVPYEILRHVARHFVHRDAPFQLTEMLRGWSEAIRS